MREIESLQCELNAIERELVRAARELRWLRLRRMLSRHCDMGAAVILAATLSSYVFAQAGGAGLTVKAPFQVFDRSGKVIFAVEAAPNGARMHVADAKGNAVVSMDDFGGGQLRAVAPDKSGFAVMHASAAGLGVTLLRGQKSAFLGEEPMAGGGKPAKKGAPVLTSGHGFAGVFSPRSPLAAAALTVTAHRGEVSVYSPSGTALATIAESDKLAATGRVKISTLKQDGVFSAGATPGEGNACVDRGESMACLRPGLPLAIYVPASRLPAKP